MRAILTYHSLDRSGSLLSVTPELFARQMAKLAESGAAVVDLAQCLATEHSVALTFDDGYQSFLREAVPVLARHRFPATVFVVSGKTGSVNEWDTGDSQFPTHQLMDWNEVREAVSSAPGITIGAHSVTHGDLSRMSPAAAEEEMVHSRDEIEQRIGRAVRCFAYPYGRSTAALREVAARHFDFCCGTDLGYLSGANEPMNLPRIDTYYLRRSLVFGQLLSPGGAAWIGVRAMLRNLRRG